MIDPMAQLFKGLRGGSWRCSPRCREIWKKDHCPKAMNMAQYKIQELKSPNRVRITQLLMYDAASPGIRGRKIGEMLLGDPGPAPLG